MIQVKVRVPDEWVAVLDAIAAEREQSREAIVLAALEQYLASREEIEDREDIAIALERCRDATDPVLDWDSVKHELLHSD